MECYDNYLPEEENVQPGSPETPETPAAPAAPAAEAPAEPADAELTPAKTPADEPAPADGPTAVWQSSRKKPTLARMFRSEKFKRGATALTAIFIAVVVVINILVSVLTNRFPSMNIDLTAQHRNSLSDQAEKVARGVANPTEIFLIGSEDFFRKNENPYYSQLRIEFSQVSNLADRLAEVNPLISVQFVDLDLNPDFVAQYSSETLSSGMVLVRTEKRYKVLQPDDLFILTQDTSGSGYKSYTNVDSCLAGALEIVNLDKVPVVAIAQGSNQELLAGQLTQFSDLMERQNYEVREFNLFTEEIPENTQLLVLPTPSNDYDPGQIQKLRDYIEDEDRRENLNILITCYPTQGELPNLASFLEEWGVRVESGTVFETDPNRKASYNENLILTEYNKNIVDNNYNYLMSGYTSPITMLFEGNGDTNVAPIWTTADTAYVVTNDSTEEELENPVTDSYNVATLSHRILQMEDYETFRRNIMVFGSSIVFADGYIQSSAFDNSRYIEDLMRYATGTGGSSVTVYSSPTETNTLDIQMSANLVTILGLGVFTIGLPVAVLIAGLVVFLKRRHL